MQGQARLIKVDGTELTFNRVLSIGEIQKLIQAPLGLDSVNLKDGHVMMVDDTGMIDGKPINEKATALYHGVRRTPYSIHGDAVVVWDEDYG